MGVPTLGCSCAVCTSSDPRDRRTRPSASIVFQDDGTERCILIDSGPDFREQALRENLRHIDAVLYTHSHADHILGLDDLRPLSFRSPEKVPLYADTLTSNVLRQVFEYTFSEDSSYPHKARVELHPVTPRMNLFGVEIVSVPLLHGTLPTFGFRFGDAAYLTDMSVIPEESFPLLRNLNTLVLDALRHKPHPSHSTVENSLKLVERIQPKRAYFTHMSHDLGHAETEKNLPAHVRLAFDGLRIPVEFGS